MKKKAFLSLSLIFAVTALSGGAAISLTRESGESAAHPSSTPGVASKKRSPEKFDGIKLEKTDAEWKGVLTPAQYYILREKGTEQPFTGEFDKNKKAGTYHCAACGLAVFHSRTKFDSGTGWPSFFAPIYKQNVTEHEDRSIGEVRTEVNCSRCGGHLGHVFDDGPEPTGLRYCINSAALKFEPSK